jgi:hypothetical protein
MHSVLKKDLLPRKGKRESAFYFYCEVLYIPDVFPCWYSSGQIREMIPLLGHYCPSSGSLVGAEIRSVGSVLFPLQVVRKFPMRWKSTLNY